MRFYPPKDSFPLKDHNPAKDEDNWSGPGEQLGKPAKYVDGNLLPAKDEDKFMDAIGTERLRIRQGSPSRTKTGSNSELSKFAESWPT